MAKYYMEEDDGFLFKVDEDGTVSILSWNGLEFMSLEDYLEDDGDEEPLNLEDLGPLADFIDPAKMFDISKCRELSKENVRDIIQDYVREIAMAGKILIDSL